MLKAQGIKKFYGHVLALDSVSIRVDDGSVYGIVGPNGAGKTSLIRILSGLLFPDEGSVEIDSLTPDTDWAEYKTRVGYIPDVFGRYPNLSVSEYLGFFAAAAGLKGLEAKNRADELLSYVELSDRADFYVDALSRGMKQKLSLARALIHDPSVLILDEPTSGLDPRTRYEYRQILGELSDQGKTIIISSHILSDISELCTDIAILDEGSVIMSGRLMDVMRTVTAQNPIVISMTRKTTQAARFLKEDKRVGSLSISGNDIRVNLRGGAKAEADLLRDLIEADLPVRSFYREQGSLEAIFMQLTGHGEEKTLLNYDFDKPDNKKGN